MAAQGLEGDLEPGLIPFVTLVPGLEVRLRLSDRALLMPFVDVGVAWTTRTKDATALTSVGIRGEFLFPAGRFELALQPHVLVSEAWARDDFFGDGLFLTSLTADVRHPLWFTLGGSQTDIGVYGTVGRYWGDTDIKVGEAQIIELRREVEFGLSIGQNPRTRIWFLRVPRLSLGFRISNDLTGFRVGFGDRILRLPPR